MTTGEIYSLLNSIRRVFPNLGGAGWALFNFRPSYYLDCSLERIDEAEIFEDDETALAWVKALAGEGDKTAIIAVLVNDLCNALRYKIWGPQWVDSRCGPDLKAKT